MRKVSILAFCLLLMATAAGVFAQDAAPPEPLGATIRLGGTDTYWLDPTFVSVMGGAVNSDPVDASTFGENCTGVVGTQPDVILEWTEDETVENLRIFFTSDGDPTMVIVAPDGTVFCSDDENALELDPVIDLPSPETGSYLIYIGSFEGDAVVPGFLVFTSSDYSPASLNLGDFAPALNPDALPDTIPLDVLHVDTAPASGSVALEAGFGTVTQDISVDGSLAAFDIDLGNPECTGFIDGVPTFAFSYAGEADTMLRLFFEGDHDSTLVVRAPDGTFVCSDDFAGAENLNPLIDFTAGAGQYLVFVGTFQPGASVTGTLTITEDLTVEPAVLTAAALEG